MTHAAAGIATFDRSIRNAISRDGVLSPESHRLTTPGFTPIAVASSSWDHSSFLSRARSCSAAGIASAMANVLTGDNLLSSVKRAGVCHPTVAAWQHGPVAKPTFRENLDTFMTAAGISGAELAARVRVDPGAVSRWLSKGHLPNAQDFLAVARVLGVDPWILVGSSFKEPGPPRKVAPPGRRPKDAKFISLLKPAHRKPVGKPSEKTSPPISSPTRRARDERE